MQSSFTFLKRIRVLTIILILACHLQCATFIGIGLSCVGQHGCPKVENFTTPVRVTGFVIDMVIANAIIAGTTAPSFGWIYGGVALYAIVASSIRD